ncbi:MAG: hypothetical protein GX193_04125 [Clostridiales bacterium]|nr:hypothetical protein [Clostridiales bacterium]
MKKHEYYFELVSLKIDNMLTADQETELEEHLASCSECRDRLVMYNSIRDLADDLLVEPPVSLVSSVMNKLELEKKGRLPRQRIVSRILTFAGAAAAIVLLLYTGTFMGFPGGGTSKNDMLTMQLSEAPAAERLMPESEEEKMSSLSDSADNDIKFALSSDGSPASATAPDESLYDSNGTAKSGGIGRSEGMPATGSNLFDPGTIKVGDEVAGFKVTDIETEYFEDARDVLVVFDGEATLSGTLYYDNNEQGFWGKFIYFYIDDDCAGFLPYAVGDDRQIWFGIENHDEAVGMLDVQPEDEGKTIAYSAVIVIDNYTVVLGSSEGCNFATLKSILTLNRLPD